MTDPATPPADESELAALLGELREPPRHWIEAAKQLPLARSEIAGIVERAREDLDYRRRVMADLEDALRVEGLAPSPQLVAVLRSGIEPTP